MPLALSRRSTRNLDDGSFPRSIEDLSSLHDPKSLTKLIEYGGIDSLTRNLHTDAKTGLTAAQVANKESRIAAYGENRLPVRASKSFLKLCWEALQDKVLIILCVAAVVSLALGLYETFGQGPEYDDEGKPMPKVQWVEGVAIIVAIAIVVFVGAGNDYQKERQFAKLNAKKEEREVIVIRDNNQLVISIYDIMVGDIISLTTGDVVPADSVLVEGQCECDESALTGESNTIKKVSATMALNSYQQEFENSGKDVGDKGVHDPFLISGSKILSGLGKAVVTAVGPNSIHGRTMLSLNHEAETTPLQERLNDLAEGIAKYGFLVAILLFIVLFIRFCINLRPGGEFSFISSAEKGNRFVNILITAITIVVVAVPEGLPLAVTLALAFATTRMAKDANLVRVLKSCETMGGATAICSDKTGTLTENRMRVIKGVFGGAAFDDNENSQIGNSSDLISQIGQDLKTFITTNISLNSTAFENADYRKDEQVENSASNAKLPFYKKWFQSDLDSAPATAGTDKSEPFIGSKTETALLLLDLESFKSYDDQRLEVIRSSAKSSIVQVIPFESSRKWGGIVMKLESGYRFYVKGASEIVFKKCSHQTNQQDKLIQLNQNDREFVLDKIDSYANDALRTLALAHKDFTGLSSWPPKSLTSAEHGPEQADPELILGEDVNLNVPSIVIDAGEKDSSSFSSTGLSLDALVGIQDPLRKGVPEAVAQCKKAGVTVRMVTGDNLLTARAISKNCGILEEDDLSNPKACMEGPVFRKLSPAERVEVVPNLRVLARSSPEDKRILVQTLKDLREVVAVTGDGTNDAPALKLADVGFSMGIAGTEVAREASDIILMTDDFSAIVGAIKWGRTVSTSIKKFIQFQLTVNITACVLTFVSAVASSEGKSVLTAVQLLWVNLIMDTLAALALATDKPDDSFLDRKPAGRTAPLIAVSTWKMILGQSTTQLIVTFTLHFGGQRIFFGTHHITDHQSTQLSAMTFNAFVWLQFFKLFVTRKLDEADGISTVKERISRNNLDFFQHLFRNWYFIAIATIIGAFQILIMFVGGAAFSIARQTPAMWATAIICGLISLPVGILLRLTPDEWVIAIFPTRAFNATLYILTLQFLRSGKKNKEDDVESSPFCEKVPAFEKAREDLQQLKTSNSHNPLSLYKEWRISRSNSNASTMTSSGSTLVAEGGATPVMQTTYEVEGHLAPPTITALMVPTVVSGAVAGWHQNDKASSSTSQ